jgi:hypothetical protein
MRSSALNEMIIIAITVAASVPIVAPAPSPFVAAFSTSRKPGASGAFGVRPRLVFDRNKLQIKPRIDKPITKGASSTANRRKILERTTRPWKRVKPRPR